MQVMQVKQVMQVIRVIEVIWATQVIPEMQAVQERQVIQDIKVIQAKQVIQAMQVMQVGLAQQWVDFRAIFFIETAILFYPKNFAYSNPQEQLSLLDNSFPRQVGMFRKPWNCWVSIILFL